jgi:deoxyhypusine synthase
MTITKIADEVKPGTYSSGEFIKGVERFLERNYPDFTSVIPEAYRYDIDVPIFVPAFSDCSAGFGLLYHQGYQGHHGCVSIDSVKDFLELTEIKSRAIDTGLVRMSGGVLKNFAQDVTVADTTVAAEVLGDGVSMHKYAIQITVADGRDSGFSGSTLDEAHSCGKVDRGNTQMVFCEVAIVMSLIIFYIYHFRRWVERKERRLNRIFEEVKE